MICVSTLARFWEFGGVSKTNAELVPIFASKWSQRMATKITFFQVSLPVALTGRGGLCVGIAQSLGGDNFKGKCLLEVRTGGQGERANDLKAAASGFLDKNQP